MLSGADYTRFLQQQWPRQQPLVARYQLQGEQVWLKRAGPRHGMWRYRLLGAAAGALRLPVLRPVPNLGGRAAIATELARLRTLGALGLRVPQVLAACADAFLMRDLGAPGRPTPSLGDEIEGAVGAGPGAVLALWRLGLQTLDAVHGQQQCLSQAFARNMVRCADGVIACIDFEDDPSSALPLVLCQLRDALAYVHSTALALLQAGAQQQARDIWGAWLAQPLRGADFQAALQATLGRLAWLRHLPQDRRWGRDAQRLRAAHDLLVAAY
ncbi:MAG: hypothetical protein JSR53_01870 [Proteobacteria bacterium]|nr:hypothetical protein [Pseudomonadota bacterium]